MKSASRMIGRIALTAALLLSAVGCQSAANLGYRQQVDPDVLYYGAPVITATESRLIPWATLKGYMIATGKGTGIGFRLLGGLAEQALFKEPNGLGAQGNNVYVIDHATGNLWRFQWRSGKVEGAPPEIKDLGYLNAIEDPTDVFVAPSGELFVSDGEGKKVVRYSGDGEALQTFEDAKNLNRPVAVTVDRRGVRLFVADSFFDQILVFNMKGESLYRMGGRGSQDGEFRNIRDMVQGREGLYIVDGLNRRIQVFGLDGTFMRSFAHDQFNDGAGIALDEDGTIYVADRFEHQIVIIKGEEVVERFGRRGNGPGEFFQPANIWFDEGYLYVADTGNSRVQVFRVVKADKGGAKTSRLVPADPLGRVEGS